MWLSHHISGISNCPHKLWIRRWVFRWFRVITLFSLEQLVNYYNLTTWKRSQYIEIFASAQSHRWFCFLVKGRGVGQKMLMYIQTHATRLGNFKKILKFRLMNIVSNCDCLSMVEKRNGLNWTSFID